MIYGNGEFKRPMTFEEGCKYVTGFAKLESYFNKDTIDFVLNSSKNAFLNEYLDEHVIPVKKDFRNVQNGCKLIRQNSYEYYTDFKTFQGKTYENVDRVKCNVYAVPAHYQTNVGKIYEAMLKVEYPWIAEYSINVYQFNYGKENTDEFYVGLKDGENTASLYVPYIALKRHDSRIIEERVRTYWSWYYSKDEKRKNEQIGVLNWESTKEFFRKVNTPCKPNYELKKAENNKDNKLSKSEFTELCTELYESNFNKEKWNSIVQYVTPLLRKDN